MERNDIRTNYKIRLYRLWEELIECNTEGCQVSIEDWVTVWDGENLRIYNNKHVVAEVNPSFINLSEQISTPYDFPLNMIEQSIAQQAVICYNSL